MQALFIIIMLYLGIVYINNPETKIQNRFEETFKENTDFYVLNDILTNEEKAKVIHSLNEDSRIEKERVFSLIKEEKKDDIDNIGKLRVEELKKDFEKEKMYTKILIGVATISIALAAWTMIKRVPF